MFLRIRDLVDKVRLFGGIARVEEQQTVARQPITSGATGLLIVAFQIFWQVVVNDVADVGLIDTHAEGDGGAHDLHFIAQEELLVSPAFLAAEASVVGACGKTTARQRFGEAICRGAARAVDDAALMLSGTGKLDDLLKRLILGQNAVGEIGAIEARNKNLRSAKGETRDHVGPHAFRSRGGQCHHGHVRQRRTQLGDLAVLGTEIVTPFTDAMRLVDRDERNVPSLQIFRPTLEHQPFGGDVE